jgi:hypothetical protein
MAVAASAPLSHFRLVIHQAACIAHPNFQLVSSHCIPVRAGLDTTLAEAATFVASLPSITRRASRTLPSRFGEA